GASKSMIRVPFIFEGVVATVLGSLLACAATWVIAEFLLGQWLSQQVADITFISGTDSWIVMPGLVLLAALLAGLSSWVTVRKHLRV
ncbi:MAG: FtsX-like permease family protein, partial [Nesterenkonia sp.]